MCHRDRDAVSNGHHVFGTRPCVTETESDYPPHALTVRGSCSVDTHYRARFCRFRELIWVNDMATWQSADLSHGKIIPQILLAFASNFLFVPLGLDGGEDGSSSGQYSSSGESRPPDG